MRIRIKGNKEYYNLDKNNTTRIYFCGPTVYNHVHIGNIRPIILADSLVKYLKSSGYQTSFTHNITDIDDKIIKAAKESSKTEQEISSTYTDSYKKVLKSLNIDTIDSMPDVTSNINGIINYIQRMIDKKSAYVVNGNVYFDISSVKQIYGSVSNRVLEELVETDSNDHMNEKINPQDFVLWKTTNEGITWKNPWSNKGGRPGWHTECCYFIEESFKNNVDIHGGGMDLTFPHHENENAQFYSLNNRPIANCWFHNGHITVNDEKMSKSLNNFILAKDVLEKYEQRVLRWFFLNTNYTKPMNFSLKLLDNSKNEINKIEKIFTNSVFELIHNRSFKITNSKLTSFEQEINDNFNSSNAIAAIWETLKQSTAIIKNYKWEELNILVNSCFNSLRSIGIYNEINITEEIIELIDELYNFRKNKNFLEADRINLLLSEKKIIA
jgi:cysteinyl-tRNA synthetase